jgi:hypothetical protein
MESIPRFWQPLFIAAEAFNYEQVIKLLEHGGSQITTDYDLVEHMKATEIS